MAKLRKMLGDPRSQSCRAMMQLIETQNKTTLALWALEFAAQRYLPICRDAYPHMEEIVQECMQNVREKAPLSRSKPLLREATALAREDRGPAAQAAARAAATACSVMQTPTGALGFLFYGAAAWAYSHAGTDRSDEEYRALAEAEFAEAYRSLLACAVKDESDPVRVNWNC